MQSLIRCGYHCQSRFQVSVSALDNDAEHGGRTANENKVRAEALKSAWEALKAKVVAAEAEAASAAAAAGETALEHELEVASQNLETKRQAYTRVDFTNETAWNAAREQVEDVLISMSTPFPRATGGGGAGAPSCLPPSCNPSLLYSLPPSLPPSLLYSLLLAKR